MIDLKSVRFFCFPRLGRRSWLFHLAALASACLSRKTCHVNFLSCQTQSLLKFLFKKLKSGYFDKYETVCTEGPKFEFQRSILSYSLERTFLTKQSCIIKNTIENETPTKIQIWNDRLFIHKTRFFGTVPIYFMRFPLLF